LTEGGDPGGNGLVIALNPDAFGLSSAFAASVSEVCNAIKALPPAAGVESILVPGERGYVEMQRRTRSGIPLPRGTLSNLLTLGSKLGVSPPDGLA
jgi:ureidoglycolate dehydrogenase (NAD+)